jgi:serpin B
MPPPWLLLLLSLQGALCQGRTGPLTEGMDGLAQSLYLHMAAQDNSSNFIFSPLSIHSALSMLYLGTSQESETANELANVLGVSGDRASLKRGYRELVDTYTNSTSFLYGNNIWIQDGLAVKKAYKNQLETYLNAGVETIDFEQEDSADKVNAWVNEKTGGKIPSLVDSFDPTTRMFLANALYFKGQWRMPFKEAGLAEFNTPSVGAHFVPMVERASSQFGYEEIRHKRFNIEVVTVPYENNQFEMKIFLPASIEEMSILEETMQFSDTLDHDSTIGINPLKFNLFSEEILTQPDEYLDEVYLKMPTFKIESDKDLAEPLRKLGVNQVSLTH